MDRIIFNNFSDEKIRLKTLMQLLLHDDQIKQFNL